MKNSAAHHLPVAERAEATDEFRRSFDVLCNCARYTLQTSDSHPEFDAEEWDTLYELASSHLVLPILSHAALSVPTSLPAQTTDALRERRRHVAMHNVFLLQELQTLQEVLESQNIPVVVLKGPVLAQMAYNDINLRSYGDLDLLVHPRDFPAVMEQLTKVGYRAAKDLSDFGRVRLPLSMSLSIKRFFTL